MKFFGIVAAFAVKALAMANPESTEENVLHNSHVWQSSQSAEDYQGVGESCHSVKCAAVTCNAPFYLAAEEGQCCPVCKNDNIQLDNHVSTGDLGFRSEASPSAHADCAGAKCFKLSCRKGEKKTLSGDACCFRCA